MILSFSDSNLELVSFQILPQDIDLQQEYISWLRDSEVNHLLGIAFIEHDKESLFIHNAYTRFTSDICKGFFIKDKTKNLFIGTLKFDKIDYTMNSAEVGVMIGNKDYWGKNCGTQAIDIILKYAFEDLKLNRIWGGCNENNLGMIKIFQKLGFKQEAVLRQADRIKEEYSDNFLYGILKSEYNTSRRQ